MALKDENFANEGKPEAYNEIIKELQQRDEQEEKEYEFDLDSIIDEDE